MKKTLLLASVACLFSLKVNASELKPYVGFDISAAEVGLSNGLGTMLEESYNTVSINAGAKMNQNFGLEAFYQFSTEESAQAGYIGESKFDSYGLDAIGFLLIDEKTNLLGSVGFGQYEIEASGPGGSVSEDSLGYCFGVGADYALTEKLSARAMIRYTSIKDIEDVDDMKEFSFGIRYSF